MKGIPALIRIPELVRMQYIGENYFTQRGIEERFSSPKPVTVPAETFVTKKSLVQG
jgi:hypothetical protein